MMSAWLMPVKKSLMIHQQVPNQCLWHGSTNQQSTRSQIFTPIDTLFWGFVTNNVNVPPLPMALRGLKHRLQQPVPKLIMLFFADYGRRLHTSFPL
jgi:hypothetical protein